MTLRTFWVWLSFLSINTFAQTKTDTSHIISSAAFEQDRHVYVHLPEQYLESPSDSFGVIYVLDAQAEAYWDQAKSIIDYLVWSYQIMPVIVVGIHSDNRGTEFIPKDKRMSLEHPDNDGEADLLLQHLEEEVMPWITNNFRITPWRVLIGHSRGGAFIAHTLSGTKRELFNAYLAISPSMGYLDGQIMKDLETTLQSKPDFHKFLYYTHGSVGSMEKSFGKQVSWLDSLTAEISNPTLQIETRVFTGTSHFSVVAPSIAYGMVAISRAFMADQQLVDDFANHSNLSIRDQLNSYYVQQQTTLGYTVPIDAASYNYYASQQSEYGNHHKALELFELALEEDPNHIQSYFGRAWAYRNLNDVQAAIKSYQEAEHILESGVLDWPEERVSQWRENLARELEALDKK